MKPNDAKEIAIHLMKFCGDLDDLYLYDSGKLNINGNIIEIEIRKLNTESKPKANNG